jgi:hypothetical protein
MSTVFEPFKIPKTLLPIIGEADPGTRLYRQVGTKEEGGRWFDSLCAHVKGGTVSPGGVSMYAKASRAAVYKRIKEGRLTAFCFHEIESHRGFFGGVKNVQKSPFIYVPVGEAKSWGKEIQARLERGENFTREEFEGEDPDFVGEFFEWNSKWRTKRLKEFRGKPLR